MNREKQGKLYRVGNALESLDVCYPILIKALFELVYVYSISPNLGYLGAWYKPNAEKALVSWVAAILITILIRVCRKTFCTVFFKVLCCITVIPSLSIYWLKNENSKAFLLICLYWLAFWGASCFFSTMEREMDSEEPGEINRIPAKLISSTPASIFLNGIYALFAIATVYFSHKFGAFRIFVRLEDVYSYRLAEGNAMSTIESYIFSWSTNAILPVFFCLHFLRKKRILVICDIVLLLMSYSIYGNKSMLFAVPLIIGLIILDRLRVIRFTSSFIALFIIAYLAVCLVVPYGWIVALGDRIMEGPAAGNYNYYDFFSEASHPLLYLRESILRFFWESPYDKATSVIIGSSAKYYSGQYNNMNNGLFSAAYANLGALGVLIQPVLIAGTSHVCYSVLRHYHPIIQYLFIILSALYLISTTYTSWLLTGGLIVEMIILYSVFMFFERNRIIVEAQNALFFGE